MLTTNSMRRLTSFLIGHRLGKDFGQISRFLVGNHYAVNAPDQAVGVSAMVCFNDQDNDRLS
jgi:hypothetical protein